jgi:hypothetical protein
MNEEHIFFALAVCLPLLVCAIAAVTCLMGIKKGTAVRLIAALLCLLPILASLNNTLNIFNNDIELITFYATPPLLLLVSAFGTVFRCRFALSILNLILLGLATISSAWMAVFVYLMRKIP